MVKKKYLQEKLFYEFFFDAESKNWDDESWMNRFSFLFGDMLGTNLTLYKITFQFMFSVHWN